MRAEGQKEEDGREREKDEAVIGRHNTSRKSADK